MDRDQADLLLSSHLCVFLLWWDLRLSTTSTTGRPASLWSRPAKSMNTSESMFPELSMNLSAPDGLMALTMFTSVRLA